MLSAGTRLLAVELVALNSSSSLLATEAVEDAGEDEGEFDADEPDDDDEDDDEDEGGGEEELGDAANIAMLPALAAGLEIGFCTPATRAEFSVFSVSAAVLSLVCCLSADGLLADDGEPAAIIILLINQSSVCWFVRACSRSCSYSCLSAFRQSIATSSIRLEFTRQAS